MQNYSGNQEQGSWGKCLIIYKVQQLLDWSKKITWCLGGTEAVPFIFLQAMLLPRASRPFLWLCQPQWTQTFSAVCTSEQILKS